MEFLDQCQVHYSTNPDSCQKTIGPTVKVKPNIFGTHSLLFPKTGVSKQADG